MNSQRKAKLGYWCGRAAMAFQTEMEKRTKQFDLGVSEGILLIVLKHHGSQSLVELARKLEHAHPSVLRNIDSLEKNGLVQRSMHPNDRRVKIVDLTEKGQELADKVDQQINIVESYSLNGFEEGESEKLIKNLKKIVVNLGDEKPCDKEH